MQRRTPLRTKRATPRRVEGRVSHVRVKPRATGKTAEEARHLERVAGLGCLLCGWKDPETGTCCVHHVMKAPGKAKRRDHRFVVPLCRDHHQGDEGVHGFGSEAKFEAHWGVDLVDWCQWAWFYRLSDAAPFWQDSVTRCRAVYMGRVMEHKKAAGRSPKDEQRLLNPPRPTA